VSVLNAVGGGGGGGAAAAEDSSLLVCDGASMDPNDTRYHP
jgi:hypothetical protein